MLYFSSMTDGRDLRSGWVRALREQGLHEPVAWLIKAGKPAAILLSQMMTVAIPILSGNPSNPFNQKLNDFVKLLEDGDQLEEFARALNNHGGDQ
jgi:hypothetical protein